MIYRIYSDLPTFRTVELKHGTNVVLAHATKDADQKDSRNGLGKTSLIEIIHFCLGSKFEKNKGLGREELMDISFSIDIDIYEQKFAITRNTSTHGFVSVSGDFRQWPIKPKHDEETNQYKLKVSDWTLLLGHAFFRIPAVGSRPKYSPTFRMLISYFARHKKKAFENPFEYHNRQHKWGKQVANTFLLDLSWEHARRWQEVQDKTKDINEVDKVLKSGAVGYIIGSIGELEASKHQLEIQTKKDQKELDSFEVHPQYKDIEQESNNITSDIHKFTNENISKTKTIELYEKNLEQEESSESINVEEIYKQSKVVFPAMVRNHLQKVHDFHKSIVENRKVFLQEEINRIKREVEKNRKNIEELSKQRAKLLTILKKSKALDEYSRLRERHTISVSKLRELTDRLNTLKKVEEDKSALKIEKEDLRLSTRRDYEDRANARNLAIDFFNRNSEYLYNRPGQLIIDINDNGYNFDVHIDRTDSEGIQLMKIYCYDLMLAQLWSSRDTSPGFLIHDSSIFADVDERQIAKAIQLGIDSSIKYKFQYIICLNSDKLPWDLMPANFDSFVRIELKDDKPESSLFGFRF